VRIFSPAHDGRCGLLRPRQHIRDRLRVPLAPPCARLLCLADDRKRGGRVAVGLSLHSVRCAPAGDVERWVAKGHPASLSSRQGLTGPRGNPHAARSTSAAADAFSLGI